MLSAQEQYLQETKVITNTCMFRYTDFVAEHDLPDAEEFYFCNNRLHAIWRDKIQQINITFSENGFEKGDYNQSSIHTEIEASRIITNITGNKGD